MRPTQSHADQPRPASDFCTPIWCAERQRMARVTVRQVITVRHDTGSVEQLLIGAPEEQYAFPHWPNAERRPSLPHPALAQAIVGAKLGDRRMYLGMGRCRSVLIEAIEPAPIPHYRHRRPIAHSALSAVREPRPPGSSSGR